MLKTTIARSVNTSHWKRLGKIKLGVTKKSSKVRCQQQHTHGEECYYRFPVDVKHFVMEPKWADKLGAEPTSLEIMLAFPTLKQNFDTKAAVYKANGSKWCYTNDDETAHRLTKMSEADPKTGQMKDVFKYMEMECPNMACPYRINGQCPERGYLEFMIPKTGEIGTFFMKTGSKVANSQMLATLEALEGFTRNRPNGMHGIRLVLRRELVVFNKDINGDGTMTRIEKYVPKLEIDFQHLLAQDQMLLGPLMGQTIALPEARVEEELDNGEDEEGEAAPAAGGAS